MPASINLELDDELSAEQIVQAALGELQVIYDGDKAAISLPRKHRGPFLAAITLGYLKCSKKDARLADVFASWCDAKEVPCVSFEIEDDCVDMLSGQSAIDMDDPFVTMNFDTSTSGRPFSKKGLMTVTEFLLEHLWDLRISPWKVSAGMLRFSVARQLIEDVHKIWDRTSESGTDRESNHFGPQTIH